MWKSASNIRDNNSIWSLLRINNRANEIFEIYIRNTTTNDPEPWGTIGGFVCAIGLLFVIYVGSARTAQLNQVNGRQNTKRSDTQDLDWVSHSKQYILSP